MKLAARKVRSTLRGFESEMATDAVAGLLAFFTRLEEGEPMPPAEQLGRRAGSRAFLHRWSFALVIAVFAVWFAANGVSALSGRPVCANAGTAAAARARSASHLLARGPDTAGWARCPAP